MVTIVPTPASIAATAGPAALPSTSSPPDKIEAAARMYLRRKHRLDHPVGEFDSGGRWYPTAAERQVCCIDIRAPSRAHPYSYMVHCRTAEHVCWLTEELSDDDVGAVRRRARELELAGDYR
jgi:hypothetical protein